MASSTEIWVLNKINQLVERFGLSPADLEVTLQYVSDRPELPSYHIGFVPHMNPDDPIIAKIGSLLGMDDGGFGSFDTIGEANAKVDQALALAPRLPTGRSR